jgi:hypothetical protein
MQNFLPIAARVPDTPTYIKLSYFEKRAAGQTAKNKFVSNADKAKGSA